jgi:hypothetical protein
LLLVLHVPSMAHPEAHLATPAWRRSLDVSESDRNTMQPLLGVMVWTLREAVVPPSAWPAQQPSRRYRSPKRSGNASADAGTAETAKARTAGARSAATGTNRRARRLTSDHVRVLTAWTPNHHVGRVSPFCLTLDSLQLSTRALHFSAESSLRDCSICCESKFICAPGRTGEIAAGLPTENPAAPFVREAVKAPFHSRPRPAIRPRVTGSAIRKVLRRSISPAVRMFTNRLIRERDASPRTIAAWREVIRLLHDYASNKLRVKLV